MPEIKWTLLSMPRLKDNGKWGFNKTDTKGNILDTYEADTKEEVEKLHQEIGWELLK